MARLLDVLVVHDSNLLGTATTDVNQRVLRTRDLDLFPVTDYYTGTRLWYMRTWVQLLHFWQTKAMADDGVADDRHPDLILIDCHFNEDKTAPKMSRGTDARGLVYGSVLTAFALGQDTLRPFGFAIYSKDAAKLSEDPLAVTMFGILESMVGRLPQYDAEKCVIPRQYFARGLANNESGQADSAWTRALQMYRERVTWLVRHRLLIVDVDSLRQAELVLSDLRGDNRERSENIAIQLGTQEILVRSLLADARVDGKWNRQRVHQLLPWLRNLQNYDWRADYEEAESVLRHIDNDLLVAPKVSDGLSRRGIAIALCMAASADLTQRGTTSAARLIDVFGWDKRSEWIEANRAIQMGLRSKRSFSEVIQQLCNGNAWPFDEAARQCVAAYLDEQGFSRDRWPAAVRGS